MTPLCSSYILKYVNTKTYFESIHNNLFQNYHFVYTYQFIILPVGNHVMTGNSRHTVFYHRKRFAETLMNESCFLRKSLIISYLSEGTGEFLDSWLTLVEKMVNPKTVLESPHTLPPKSRATGLTPFNPVQYLITTQKVSHDLYC